MTTHPTAADVLRQARDALAGYPYDDAHWRNRCQPVIAEIDALPADPVPAAPAEPTPEMLHAVRSLIGDDAHKAAIWRAMWAAQPAPQASTPSGEPAATFSPVTVLPDGSAFATASFPLPKDHWLTAPRGEWDSERDEYAECPAPILTHAHRDAVRAAVRYAVRGATMCGQDSDFDPDALVLNAIYALCGPFGGATTAPAPLPAFDMLAHLKRQAEFSAKTFGPGARIEGVTDHIAKELREVRESGGDLAEWVDVIILAFDGAWRSGASPAQIIDAMVAKQTKNEGRKWPDWRTAPADKAIEHDRSGEVGAAPLLSNGPETGATASVAGPLNGIAATMFHGEGAIAQCHYCKRYTLDPKALADSRQPICDCGKQHYWSGSFKRPGPDAQWFGAAPQAAPVPAPSDGAEIDAMVDKAWGRFEAELARGSKAQRVHAIVNAGPFPGMSESFNAHMGAECWTDPAYAPDASTWAAAWKAAHPAPAVAATVRGLTDEQIVMDGLMMVPTARLESCADAFTAGVRFAERAHGIATPAPKEPGHE